MAKITTKPNTPNKISDSKSLTQLIDSARRNELVVVIGSGVSMALTNGKVPALSWKGLVADGFAHGVLKGVITNKQSNSWKNQRNSDDLDDLLGAAEFMARKLNTPSGDIYSRWLEGVFKPAKPAASNKMVDAIKAIHKAGIPLCTLNYDTLLEHITGLPEINLNESSKVNSWMRRESAGVLHLHGSWTLPDTCVLGIRDYESTLDDDVRDLIQRSLGSFKRLLFIGCGDTFADPNFSALIQWLRVKMKAATPQHFALVSDGDFAARHADPTWHGFVDPISYGSKHDELPVFLLHHLSSALAMPVKKNSSLAKSSDIAAKASKVLEDYRTFLLKDCGQMTIEGVRADMDTAQRRFDLERLFVPLKALACPPEIPQHDPEREQKLQKWHEENKEPLSFGKVFAKHKRIALLALPGGGKTLLLKRLAVAYADPTRRTSSNDSLPNINLMPVIIRCREWREFIQRPIATLLKNIADITGQANLTNLSDALIPLLKKGKVLLLIDGLDEIHNDADRTTFVDHLEVFLEEYDQIRLVVTSREAGFSLVAPSLARFCERWRVAPLGEDAITALCDHWHLLMSGDALEVRTEGHELAQHLLRNSSLRRLAENPLLLTMLLVVKHGAGRLPPDRVSLYERAVEVLLDTWNIKGHEALNPKEAVPQLSYVAFQLMLEKKQTATEKELLALLEEAREKVPHIRRYAKDTPHEFLKRVELRSSLLVEVGHQLENGRTVPFYQFRHLTFQEYLAASASVDGFYLEYKQGDTPLTPLKPFLAAEEWKEIIPMAAVLAKKHAEPLISALVAKGKEYRRKVESGSNAAMQGNRERHSLPPAVSRLIQCLVEEAEVSSATLAEALQIIVYFGGGCISEDNWDVLSRGPYGEELLHHAWKMYAPMDWPQESWLRNTYAVLAARRKPDTYWVSVAGLEEIKNLISSDVPEDVARGLLICAGLIWGKQKEFKLIGALPLAEVERNLFQEEPALWVAASWAYGLIRTHQKSLPHPSIEVMDRLLSLMLTGDLTHIRLTPGFALIKSISSFKREEWAPVLSKKQLHQLRKIVDENIVTDTSILHREVSVLARCACLAVAMFAGNVYSDDELANRLADIEDSSYKDDRDAMLKILGKAGAKRLRKRETSNK
ncbi:MAG: SIR2 family protein [Sideroxyarcus sp.]